MTATTSFCSNEKRKLFSRFFELVCGRAPTLVPNGYDRDVYLFIADRSLPFGKLSKDIPDRWFLGGVAGKGNTRGHRAGLSMGRAQLYKSRKVLRERGLVRDQKVGRCKRYAVALEPVWPLLSAEEREMFAPLLALVDPDWQADDQAKRVHSVDVQQVHAVDPPTEKRCPFRTRTEEKKSSARELAPDAGPGSFPFSEQEEGAHAPVEAAPAVAPATPPAAKVTPSAPIQADRPAPQPITLAKRGRVPRELWASTLVDRFDAAFRQFWPDVELPVAPSGKLRGQWESFSRRWQRTDISVADWIAWAVENWRGVYVTVFRYVEHRQEREAKKLAEAPWSPKSHWRTRMDCPEYPDLAFLLRYQREFQNAYDRRASQKIRAGLTREDDLVRRFMFRGYSHADALAEAHEIMAKDKKREDLDALAAELNAKVRNLEAEKQSPEYRLAVARIRSGKDPEATWVKPVALAKPRVKPTFKHANDLAMPLPPISVWRDDLNEGSELSARPWTGQLPSRDPAGIKSHA